MFCKVWRAPWGARLISGLGFKGAPMAHASLILRALEAPWHADQSVRRQAWARTESIREALRHPSDDLEQARMALAVLIAALNAIIRVDAAIVEGLARLRNEPPSSAEVRKALRDFEDAICPLNAADRASIEQLLNCALGALRPAEPVTSASLFPEGALA